MNLGVYVLRRARRNVQSVGRPFRWSTSAHFAAQLVGGTICAAAAILTKTDKNAAHRQGAVTQDSAVQTAYVDGCELRILMNPVSQGEKPIEHRATDLNKKIVLMAGASAMRLRPGSTRQATQEPKTCTKCSLMLHANHFYILTQNHKERRSICRTYNAITHANRAKPAHAILAESYQELVSQDEGHIPSYRLASQPGRRMAEVTGDWWR